MLGNVKNEAGLLFNKKIARSRRLSISGRWIAFFVKKIEKRTHPW